MFCDGSVISHDTRSHPKLLSEYLHGKDASAISLAKHYGKYSLTSL